MEIHKLTITEVESLHDVLIDIGEDNDVKGFLNKSALEFAIDTIKYSNTHDVFYHNLALLMRNIIGQHPFIDCNKRTGYFLVVIILEKNDISLDLTDLEVQKFVVDIALGKFDDLSILAKFLKSKSVKLN